MPTDELIIRLFCKVDDHLGRVNKRSDAHLFASEIVTNRETQFIFELVINRGIRVSNCRRVLLK